MLESYFYGRTRTNSFMVLMCSGSLIEPVGAPSPGCGHSSLITPSPRIERFGGSQAGVINGHSGMKGEGESVVTIPTSWLCGGGNPPASLSLITVNFLQIKRRGFKLFTQ